MTTVPTASPTVTNTPAVGEGSWTFVPSTQPFVSGNSGYSGVLTYIAGPTAWPATGGLLTVYFPLGISAPTSSNFYVAPAFGSQVSNYSFIGSTVSVQVSNLAPGSSIPFYYGYLPSGVAVNTTQSTIAISLAAYVDTASAGAGASVIPNTGGYISVVQPTTTPTTTLTFTVSPTFSPTPTYESPTITPTWTESPIAAAQGNSVFSYPNPFDISNFSKCTFRFPAATYAKVTVFNLVGEPVRVIPDSDINAAQGWAVWPGVDDYLHQVAGGLYYVRVQTPTGTVIKHFTVLH
jgi:hypothetical protein